MKNVSLNHAHLLRFYFLIQIILYAVIVIMLTESAYEITCELSCISVAQSDLIAFNAKTVSKLSDSFYLTDFLIKHKLSFIKRLLQDTDT